MFERILRALRLLAMTAWVGGLAFFAFVVAPVAFGRLPSTHDAGLVVGGSLSILHWIGLVGGVLFCLATATLWFRAEVPARVGFAIEMVLAGIMLAVTAYSQFQILPSMERDRIAAGGAIETADISSPARIDFERLHVWSERLEGLVLLCGIGVVLVLARESQWPETGKISRI
ncbi:DUF4149 domain-containing protein [Edaphobacter modestus]|uniref:Uncharacterized protein DUF4149 n=1 Tax=Edaphobacter modestus TaxID=388466 RepID=A0A4Q7YP47_9BACT|nr:DUF4149 domain-containing protein [Edaphobacter modestus]RZU39532.1 uncharacterized protein DUF4149 [Edaphobacter modestus]